MQNTLPNNSKNMFFSSAYGTFSKIGPMLSHKLSLHRFKKIAEISNIFSDYNGMKLEKTNKRKLGKFRKLWKLDSV